LVKITLVRLRLASAVMIWLRTSLSAESSAAGVVLAAREPALDWEFVTPVSENS
jgi:hypothetical protein